MAEKRTPDTRQRILTVAAELFQSRGYIETSLRDIARELGLSKAAILYHFPTKDAILTELAEPMLAASEHVLAEAGKLATPEAARWAVIEGLVDMSFAHLRILAIANAAWVMRDPVYQRVIAINAQALEIIAGPGAGLRERVRASAALALVARPALFHREDRPADVRREILAAARQLFGAGNLVESPVQIGPVDRRRTMTPEKLAEVNRLRVSGELSVDELARAVGVSRATLYRHIKDSASGKTRPHQI